ncbi:unnamed protein product [Oreochromis niloticus]|nr:unnamed protein product [Mustela putorius furo]
MSTVTSALHCWIWMSACLLVPVSTFSLSATVQSGINVHLSCFASVYDNNNITAVQWSRSDLEPEYVLLYQDEQFVTDNQHPSFVNRVDLEDRQMEDGDVSLILKDVTTADNGTYECRVQLAGTNREKGAVFKGNPICSVNLRVVPPGPPDIHKKDGGFRIRVVIHPASLTVFILLVVGAIVGCVSCRKYRQRQSQSS